ncbi:hypothetical protein K0A97_02045 [Patescibacteria group bacterium]|nr:hypothetical protein [Patescibacteria group bacterium]
MSFKSWKESRMKNLTFCDIGLIKWSVFAFTLMVAKLWNPILSLEWYWYALVFVIAAVIPSSKMLKKGK